MTDLNKDQDVEPFAEDDEDDEWEGSGIRLGAFRMSTSALFIILVAAYFIIGEILNRGV